MLRGIFLSAAAGLAVPLFVPSALAQMTQYDGTYVGTRTVIYNPSTNTKDCGATGEAQARTMKIVNGVLSFVYNPTGNEVITGTVRADGSVAASGTSFSGGNSLTAKVQGSDLVGQYGSGYCNYSFQLKKR